MINDKIEKELTKKQSNTILPPQYQDYCFANIHNTIINLLTGHHLPQSLPEQVIPKGEFSHIILILIDALGYLSFKRFQHLFSLPAKSVITPLTSIFPSTTAAALSTFSTGLSPAQHGLFEWHLYLPEVGKIIKTLPFCFENSHQQDQLASLGFNPKKIFFDTPTIYQKLASKKIPSFVFNHQDYYKSAFAKIAQNGAKSIPFTTLSELSVSLPKTIDKVSAKYQKTFTYAYLDSLDYISHKHGPESDYFEAELAQVALAVNQIIAKLKKSRQNQSSGEKLIIITADHGQIQVDPKETIYLNRFRKLRNSLAQDKDQLPILATGGPRDVFLHLKEGKEKVIIPYLEKKLANIANVYSTSQIVNSNWFGNQQPSLKFKKRLGDVLILPKGNRTIWLSNDKKKIDKFGHHGGLTLEEMLIPFIAQRI